MSHSTVMVIGEDYERQLAPFDENRDMPRYVEATKEELIAKSRKDIEVYRDGTYAKYLADPAQYEAECSNPRHLEYVRDEFPKKLTWTDEELYAEAIKYEEPENIGEAGQVYSTRNPHAKWDWYSLGGRWYGYFTLKPGAQAIARGEVSFFDKDKTYPEGKADSARKGDIDFEAMYRENREGAEKQWAEYEALTGDEKENYRFRFDISKDETRESYVTRRSGIATFAVLRNGVWYEKGEMGWWGLVSNEKAESEWSKEFDDLLASLPDDTILTIVDVHI
jgi:hypothetical protein